MKDYYNLLNNILLNGKESDDRTGTGTLSTFGAQMRFDLTHGFPLLTGKYINYKAVFNEFQWMVVEGSVDVTWLEERGHKFWSAWKRIDNTIGLGYGYQFRFADGIDQVQDVIDSLKNNPSSRRHIISLWNPAYIPNMSLPPCHGNLIQFNVNNGELNCMMTQRSADCFLGLPWNIASYALMSEVFAHLTGLKANELIISIGDAHIYKNHIDQVKELLSRDHDKYALPKLNIKRKVDNIDDFTIDDFEIVDYQYFPAISAPVAV
jgi:thymidylate synthase